MQRRAHMHAHTHLASSYISHTAIIYIPNHHTIMFTHVYIPKRLHMFHACILPTKYLLPPSKHFTRQQTPYSTHHTYHTLHSRHTTRTSPPPHTYTHSPRMSSTSVSLHTLMPQVFTHTQSSHALTSQDKKDTPQPPSPCQESCSELPCVTAHFLGAQGLA